MSGKEMDFLSKMRRCYSLTEIELTKRAIIDATIAKMKGMDPKEVFMMMIRVDGKYHDRYGIDHFRFNRDFFTALMLAYCSDRDVTEFQIKKSIDYMAKNLVLGPIYPDDVHHFTDIGESYVIDKIERAMEDGIDIGAVYESMAEEILTEDPYTKRIVTGLSKESRLSVKCEIIEYLAEKYQDYVTPLQPEFEAERQHSIDKVLSYLD
jgi:hypothetical protein